MRAPRRPCTGPLEVVAVEFPGHPFKGELMRGLTAAVEGGSLRIVDLAFVCKDASGAVASYELAELEEPDAALFDMVDMTLGVLSIEDIEKVSAALCGGWSAAVLVLEHSWVTDLEHAIESADGRFLVRERIPENVAAKALADLDADVDPGA